MRLRLIIAVLLLLVLAACATNYTAAGSAAGKCASSYPYATCRDLDAGVIALVDGRPVTVEDFGRYQEIFSTEATDASGSKHSIVETLVHQEIVLRHLETLGYELRLPAAGGDPAPSWWERRKFAYLVAQHWLIEERLPADERALADWMTGRGDFSTLEKQAWLAWLTKQRDQRTIVVDPAEITRLPK